MKNIPDGSHLPPEIRDILESNMTSAAWVKREEQRMADAMESQIVDLNLVARDQWDRFIDWHVKLAPVVETYLQGHSGGLTKEEVQGLEIVMEEHYGVADPFYISMTASMQTHGRPWAYVEAVSSLFSGFTLSKEESFGEMSRRLTGGKQ